jgi:hypothetical protein
MSKLFTRASVAGASLSGANLKATMLALVDALNVFGVTESSRTTVTASATLTVTQCGILLVDCTAGSVVLTLPTSGTATDESEYRIRRIDSTTANTLTVQRGGTDTVEGVTTAVTIPLNGQTDFKMPAGSTNWRVVSRGGGTAESARNTLAASPVVRGHIDGLIMSTAGASATFAVAAGQATDSAGAFTISLAASISKTTSAWAVGTGNGGLDTGAIANSTWYHAHLIRRPDTGVVDVLVSLSATAPTMPTGYTQSRRIGAMKTNGSAQWTKFSQIGDDFLWDVPVADVNTTNPGTAAVLSTLTVPTGVKVRAQLGNYLRGGASASASLITAPEQADTAPNLAGPFTAVAFGSTESAAYAQCYTDTSGRIRYRLSFSDVNVIVRFTTSGWTDLRGRDA